MNIDDQLHYRDLTFWKIWNGHNS